MPAAAERKRSAAPAVQHLDDCPGSRVESYDVVGPNGSATVVRCVDCGATTINDSKREVA